MPLRRLRKDENEGKVDGALPITFELSRSVGLDQRFAGPRLFAEGVDTAVWSFCDSIVRHLREWQPRPVRTESEASLEAAPERAVIREADIPGGKVRIFDDGSIEHETAAGTNWFRNFAELERSLSAKNSLPPPQNETDPNGRIEATSDTPPTEKSPTLEPPRF